MPAIIESDKRSAFREITMLFLKLGTIGFGGPAAHIALMENEVVRKRKWMSHEHFLDLVGATNLIPGPNSTELAMHCGMERGGKRGLVLAGLAFIFPAALLTLILAFFYSKYGSLPQVSSVLSGIQAAVIAVIISSLIPLSKKAFKSLALFIIAIFTMLASFSGMNEIVALFAAGLAGILFYLIKTNSNQLKVVSLPLLLIPFNLKLFLILLKIGALLYGSGYVLISFLDTELVARGMLSKQQLLDAVSAGQITPGPVLSTVTFIGYQLSGLSGAILCTVAIFLPSFLFIMLLNPLIPKMRNSKIMSAFIDAVNVAAIALILVVCLRMSNEALSDWRTILIGILSFLIILTFKKVNNLFIILGAGLISYFLFS